MDVITSFGSYTFPANQQVSYTSNSANGVPINVRALGMTGSFDAYGTEALPVETMNVRVSFWLRANSDAEMQTKREDVERMAARGLQVLRKTATGGKRLWCFAKTNNITMNQAVDGRPHRNQKVDVDFQCTQSVWFLDTGVHLDGTVQVGNAAVLGGTGVFNEDLIAPPLAIDVPQLIPYSGTREALAVWHFWPYEGMSIVDPYLAIYDSAMIEIARVTYEGTFSDTDQVMIDAQTKKVIAPNETYPYENLTATNGKWIPIPVDACYYFCVNTGGSDPVGAFNLEFYETYG